MAVLTNNDSDVAPNIRKFAEDLGLKDISSIVADEEAVVDEKKPLEESVTLVDMTTTNAEEKLATTEAGSNTTNSPT
jgi:hypothetical protein